MEHCPRVVPYDRCLWLEHGARSECLSSAGGNMVCLVRKNDTAFTPCSQSGLFGAGIWASSLNLMLLVVDQPGHHMVRFDLR